MNPVLPSFVAGVVRAWTRFYTWGLPPGLRDARRHEIESDLWESQHDPTAASRRLLPFVTLSRLLMGMPNDLMWRAEQASRRLLRGAIAATVGLAGALAVWLLLIGAPAGPLPVPDLPQLGRRPGTLPPPPPPPPPPCLPHGLSRPPGCTRL